MPDPLTNTWSRIKLPSWLWGGRPERLLEEADFTFQRDSDDRSILVRTGERHYRRAPDLVQLIKAAGPGATTNGLAQLSTLADDAIDSDGIGVADAHLRRAFEQGDLLGMVRFYQLAMIASSASQLPDQAHAALESIRDVTTVEDQTNPFSNAGIYAVRCRPSLLHRVKLVSVLLRIVHDPVLGVGRLDGLQREQAQLRSIFASSSGLHAGYYMLDPFVGPVLGALTPGVWGVATGQPHGQLIHSFGRPISGSAPEPPEFLRTLPTNGADRVVGFASIPALAVPTALSWWTAGLNQLLSVVTDPLTATNASGAYVPTLHLENLLTVEQLFRRTLSIQANHHDLNARQVLLFTNLDTLESLTGRPIEKNADLAFAERTLERLKELIPEAAHPVLMPRAERAVEALREVQDGFFIGVSTDRSIELEQGSGRRVSLAKAAAQYLKMLRNATHGHGGKSARAQTIADTLLACHNGNVPHDVSLLGWLYLLDLLARPEVLHARLTSRATRHP